MSIIIPMQLIQIEGAGIYYGQVIRFYENGKKIIKGTPINEYKNFITTGEPCNYITIQTDQNITIIPIKMEK